MKPKIAPIKKDKVNEIKKLIQEYPVWGIVNMENLPTPQLQRMRAKLKKDVVIFMAKKRLIKIALDELKDKLQAVDELKSKIKGMPALVFTKENPFKLFKILKQNKSSAPAKAGQEAPNDIVVPAGPTGFAPGPIISDLGQVGLKTGVEAGKIVIKEEKLVAKEGDVIDAKLADVLTKLKIEPMEIGLNMIYSYENGVIFNKDVLDIDDEAYRNNIIKSYQNTFNLAMHIAYVNKLTIKYLLQKAYRNCRGLALSQDILTKDTVKEVLTKVNKQMLSLKAKVPD